MSLIDTHDELKGELEKAISVVNGLEEQIKHNAKKMSSDFVDMAMILMKEDYGAYMKRQEQIFGLTKAHLKEKGYELMPNAIEIDQILEIMK